MDAAVRWTEQDAVDFEGTLTPESLSAIMRATWTWDDRALRRDLSQLLVDLAAARAVEVTLPSALATAAPVRRVLRWRNMERAGRFLAHVLGPRLVADTGQSNTFELAEAVLAGPSLRLPAAEQRAALLAVAGYVLGGSAAASPALAAHPGTAIPVAHGGVGGGPCEIGAVLEGLGAHPAPSPFLATSVLAGYALLACRDVDAHTDLLAAIASGTVTATLAAAERSGSWDPALVRCRATPVAGGWVLNGHKAFVPDATTAGVLLVVARTTGGPTLFAVPAGAPGLATTPMATLDPTRPLGEVHLTDTPARQVGADGAAGALMSRVLDLATLAVAAEQVGLAQSCLDIAVAHVGRGVCEADRLAVAEMYLQVVSARAIACDAADQAGRRDAAAPAAAARAHIRCSQAAVTVVNRAMAVMGECAIEDGHPLQVRHRRAVASELLFGGPAVSHERLLERLGI
jgi:alkylation response protein AidB-like acyl-CoA dehydrogenase